MQIQNRLYGALRQHLDKLVNVEEQALDCKLVTMQTGDNIDLISPPPHA